MNEVEKKAKEYAKEYFPCDEFKQSIVIRGCLKFYEQGQKDTEEKMKCCGNCCKKNRCAKYHDYDDFGMTQSMVRYNCSNYSEWELAK